MYLFVSYKCIIYHNLYHISSIPRSIISPPPQILTFLKISGLLLFTPVLSWSLILIERVCVCFFQSSRTPSTWDHFTLSYLLDGVWTSLLVWTQNALIVWVLCCLNFLGRFCPPPFTQGKGYFMSFVAFPIK